MVQQGIVLVYPPGRIHSGWNDGLNLGFDQMLIRVEGILRAIGPSFTDQEAHFLAVGH
jgi:hypothetical protein